MSKRVQATISNDLFAHILVFERVRKLQKFISSSGRIA